jgi:hypothetical protein
MTLEIFGENIFNIFSYRARVFVKQYLQVISSTQHTHLHLFPFVFYCFVVIVKIGGIL